MNKKGFTLIELLGVLIILGLLILLIVPTVKNLLNDSTESLVLQQEKTIIDAARKYMIENNGLLPEDQVCISVATLISEGVIENDSIINPKTKEEMEGCVLVKYNSSYNQYDYSYVEE